MKFGMRVRLLAALPAVSLFLAACASTLPAIPDAAPLSDGNIPTQEQLGPDPQETEEIMTSNDPFEGVALRFNPNYWPDTDFSKHSIDYSKILSGGPPPDGIPSIDDPKFESVPEADTWLTSDAPVMLFQWNGDARAYPLAILVFHEIVNDVVGEKPVTLTFCPLCNATIAFDRKIEDGRVLDFGTSGNLLNSDLVMYDRQSKSWWQQFTGRGIVGELTGTQLTFLPSQIVSWEDFATQFPAGKVLSRETGYVRSYGRNPYPGYDSIDNNPFLYDGDVDGRLPAMERVVAIQLDGISVAYAFSTLKEVRVANDTVAGQSIVIFWKGGTESLFSLTSSDTGSTAVYSREVDGGVLTFAPNDEGFRDLETNSLWSLFGLALSGPLEGTQLTQIVSAEHFWFAWAAFLPDTTIWVPG